MNNVKSIMFVTYQENLSILLFSSFIRALHSLKCNRKWHGQKEKHLYRRAEVIFVVFSLHKGDCLINIYIYTLHTDKNYVECLIAELDLANICILNIMIRFIISLSCIENIKMSSKNKETEAKYLHSFVDDYALSDWFKNRKS